MAKKANNEGFLDRISSLPDPILRHILSFLPSKDVVRTSIISSRWRYLFCSMSSLDFDHYSSPQDRENVINFKNFVDRFFFHPSNSSLECFKVNDRWIKERFRVNDRWINDPYREEDYFRIYSWICAALWRGVKKIDVVMCKEHVLELPTHLFTCPSLTTLSLCLQSIMNVPTNLCLPNLKTLQLKSLKFKGGCSIHRLISCCHVLEDLVITDCCFGDISELNIHNLSLKRLVLDYVEQLSNGSRNYDYVIVINAPSLVYFQYIDKPGKGYTLSNMDSLEKADICMDPLDEVDRELSATQFLRGIPNVKSLHLTINGLATLPQRLLDKRIAFHNLVELKFQNDHGEWKGTWLVNFLHCVPNLKTLTLKLFVWQEEFEVLPEKVPSCLLFHLKEIKFSRFVEDEEDMFELVGYFLKNAIVLEKLELGIETLSEIGQLNILKEILRLPKHSKKCQFVTC